MNILKPYPVINGYTNIISQLICFLQFTRNCTLKAVENCTTAQLDFLPQGINNSPATLLRHIAALEFQFQQVTFYNKLLNNEQMLKWYGGYATELSLNYVREQPLSYYIALLEEQRNVTLELLKFKNDEWLLTDNPAVPKANNLFFWYHLAEDELCHTGQIKLILKRASL
jgi:DinB superfamily